MLSDLKKRTQILRNERSAIVFQRDIVHTVRFTSYCMYAWLWSVVVSGLGQAPSKSLADSLLQCQTVPWLKSHKEIRGHATGRSPACLGPGTATAVMIQWSQQNHHPLVGYTCFGLFIWYYIFSFEQCYMYDESPSDTHTIGDASVCGPWHASYIYNLVVLASDKKMSCAKPFRSRN